MKTHTLVFSPKAFAGLAAALTGGGTMLFGLGVMVGMLLRGTTPGVGTPAATAAPPTAAAPAATQQGSVASAASYNDPGAWPFPGSSASGPDANGAAPEPTTVPVGTPVTTPHGRPGSTSEVAFYPDAVEPSVEDTASYIVQVGAFRSETNATRLAGRLRTAGYRPTVSIRDEGGRPLHVVRVGRIVGRDVAERLAARIGDAERVVASVVINRRGN